MIPIIHKFLYSLIQRLLSIPFFIINFVNPFFHLSGLRFKAVHYKEVDSPYLAIFVIYQEGSLPFYVKNMIEALTANEVKVVVATGDVNNDTACHAIDRFIPIIIDLDRSFSLGVVGEARACDIISPILRRLSFLAELMFSFKYRCRFALSRPLGVGVKRVE